MTAALALEQWFHNNGYSKYFSAALKDGLTFDGLRGVDVDSEEEMQSLFGYFARKPDFLARKSFKASVRSLKGLC